MPDPLEPTVLWLPCQGQRVVPWRNGGGHTREVAVEPPGAGVAAGFRWRISIAGVARDGPFSSFPGVDRRLWLLAGDGLLLDFGGRAVRLDRALQHCAFRGEDAVSARLLGGPTIDLNVMTERATVVAQAEVLALGAAQPRRVTARGPQHVVLAVAGAVRLPRLREALGEGDALRIDGALDLVIEPLAAAAVLVATFTPTAAGG